MSKRAAPSSTTRGRGRGRGRGASSAAASSSKRSKKIPERECLFLLIDSGANSSFLESNGKSSFDNSVNITDWILSRKIFAESSTFVNVGYYPSLTTSQEYVFENAAFESEMFKMPTIDQLKWVHNISQGNADGDFIKALKGTVELINEGKSDAYNDKISIVIASNSSGEIAEVSDQELKELCDSINDNGIELVFIGDNTTSIKVDIPASTLNALKYIKENCTTTSQMFENALNKVSFFAQKPKQLRSQPFKLELSKDFHIDLQLYVKITEEKLAIKFHSVTADNEEVDKIREFEEAKDVKEEPDEALESLDINNHTEPQKISKGDLIKGYHYGASIIPFSDADKKMAAADKIGKCLQLVQFTKRVNILRQFLFNECRYFIPSDKSDSAQVALKALVQAMLKEEVVAITRYAYNIVSNPRLAVLIPKISKSGCPILQHFILPFNEDVRSFDFPDLETVGEEPTDYQIDTMDAYIDQMMLIDEVKNEDGTKTEIEQCRIRDIRNPANQAVLMAVKRKALGMPTELSEDETKALLEMMSPPAEKLEKAKRVMDFMKKSFNLTQVEPEEEKSAGINGKSLAEIQGRGKIEKYEDMDVE